MQPPTAYASYPACVSVSIIKPTFFGNAMIILPAPYLHSISLICLSPIYQLMRRLAAADADPRNFLPVVKRHTSCGCRKIFFYFIFTRLFAAPHTADKALFVKNRFRKLLIIVRVVDVRVPVRFCTRKHIMLNGFQQLFHLCFQFIQ